MADGTLNEQYGIFHLSKWFLDFTGDHGEAMIFYAAKLRWYGITIGYTSWLKYDPDSGVKLKSRFSQVKMPVLNDGIITWKDPGFRISGTWKSEASMIQARLFESPEGYLDWKCYQPASKVDLLINNERIAGEGYAEQLILTAPPWKIPMDELRWGRFVSENNKIVWIELRRTEKKQWLWLNGEKIGNCCIEDGKIEILDTNISLNLDRGVLLESEKKIQSVVGKIIRYIPNFHKSMPLGFLMADECKWLSRAELYADGNLLSKGMAIHELVNFNSGGSENDKLKTISR